MADNTQTDLATTAGDVIADEDIAGVKYQRVKLIDATVGSTSPVGTAANPLYVTSAAAASAGLTDTELRASALPVSGAFYPATQPVSVSGTVPVSGAFYQATQPVSLAAVPSHPVTNTGAFAVQVTSAPSTPVTGTFYQATQPVSLAAQPLPTGASTETTLAALKGVADSLLTAAQAIQTAAAALNTKTTAVNTGAIAGTVAVSNLPGTQPVSTAALPLPDGASSEVTLASVLAAVSSLSSAISQHDTVASDGHGGIVLLAKRRDSDGSATVADGDFGYLSLDENQRVKVATQPASVDAATGSITANAQNVSIKCGRFGNIAVSVVATTLVGHNASFECSNNSTTGTDGNWYGVQAVRSNANTVEAATGVLAATPVYMWHVNVGDYQYFRVRATAHTSGTAAYILKPGAYATEPIPAVQVTGTQPVSGTVAVTLPTPSTLNTSSLATTNALLVKSSAGTLYNIVASNVGAAAAYLKLYNKATAPTVGTDVPVLVIPIGPGAMATITLGALGHRFALGIGIGITGAAADTDTTVIAAAQVKVLTSFI